VNHNYTIKERDILLRPVVEQDIESMRNWRNSDWARNFFLDSSIITKEQQQKWFENYLEKTDDFMFIIEWQGKAVGMVGIYNVNKKPGHAEFGRLLIGEELARGKGIGKKTVELLSKFAMQELKIKQIDLEVFADNERALAIYQKCGYVITNEYQINNRKVYQMALIGES